MNETITTNDLSQITITSLSTARKRTINECADILSSHGSLVDFERHSTGSIRFAIEIKPDVISHLINSLKRIEYIKEDIDSYITENKAPKRKPMLVNISLNFLSN